MIATIVGTEMVGQRCVCMFHGYLVESGIARQAGRFEQQFQVHHIINDYRALPAACSLPATVGIPRLDNACSRTETGGQRLGSLYNHILILCLTGQTISVQIAATDHETYIVMPLQVFYRVQVFRIFLGQLLPFLVAGQFISQPHAAGEKARAPVVNGHIVNASILFDGTGIQYLTGFLDNVGLQGMLRHRIVDVVLDEVALRLLLACATCKNQEGNSQGCQGCFHNKGL